MAALHGLPRSQISSRTNFVESRINRSVGCQPHWLTRGPVALMRVYYLLRCLTWQLHDDIRATVRTALHIAVLVAVTPQCG